MPFYRLNPLCHTWWCGNWHIWVWRNVTFPQRWCSEETLSPSRPVPSTRRNTSDHAHRLIFIRANLKQESNLVVLNIFFHANKKKKEVDSRAFVWQHLHRRPPVIRTKDGSRTHTHMFLSRSVCMLLQSLLPSFSCRFFFSFFFFSLNSHHEVTRLSGIVLLRGLSCLHALRLWVRGSRLVTHRWSTAKCPDQVAAWTVSPAPPPLHHHHSQFTDLKLTVPNDC